MKEGDWIPLTYLIINKISWEWPGYWNLPQGHHTSTM